MTRLIDAEDIAKDIEENSIEMNGVQVIEVSCAKALIDIAPTIEPQMTELEEHFYHRCGFLQGMEYGKELTSRKGEEE